jgi:hypothetical protein
MHRAHHNTLAPSVTASELLCPRGIHSISTSATVDCKLASLLHGHLAHQLFLQICAGWRTAYNLAKGIPGQLQPASITQTVPSESVHQHVDSVCRCRAAKANRAALPSAAASEALTTITPSGAAVRHFPHHSHSLEFGPVELDGDRCFVTDDGKRVEVLPSLKRWLRGMRGMLASHHWPVRCCMVPA